MPPSSSRNSKPRSQGGSPDLAQLQKRLGITFKNPALLRQAFTHSSYVNENRGAQFQHNERIEFLGDAVLELAVSEFLFSAHPDMAEGELTKLRASIVCEPSLMRFAEKLDFGKYVFLGKGEERTGGRSRPALLADVFESFVGALFLDQGLGRVRAFLHEYVFPDLETGNRLPMTDYKTRLQELVQQTAAGVVEYRLIEEIGPAHDRQFVTEVYLNGELYGTGTGRSKKESEQRAAAMALDRLAAN